MKEWEKQWKQLNPNWTKVQLLFIQSQLDKAREEVLHTTAETIEMVIGTIALDQGWEETGDKYRKMYGLPTLYTKGETK